MGKVITDLFSLAVRLCSECSLSERGRGRDLSHVCLAAIIWNLLGLFIWQHFSYERSCVCFCVIQIPLKVWRITRKTQGWKQIISFCKIKKKKTYPQRGNSDTFAVSLNFFQISATSLLIIHSTLILSVAWRGSGVRTLSIHGCTLVESTRGSLFSSLW